MQGVCQASLSIIQRNRIKHPDRRNKKQNIPATNCFYRYLMTFQTNAEEAIGRVERQRSPTPRNPPTGKRRAVAEGRDDDKPPSAEKRTRPIATIRTWMTVIGHHDRFSLRATSPVARMKCSVIRESGATTPSDFPRAPGKHALPPLPPFHGSTPRIARHAPSGATRPKGHNHQAASPGIATPASRIRAIL